MHIVNDIFKLYNKDIKNRIPVLLNLKYSKPFLALANEKIKLY